MAGLRWLNYDWKNREKYTLRLMKCVRFSLMPPWFLVSLIKTNNCTQVDNVVKYPEIQKMINDSIT